MSDHSFCEQVKVKGTVVVLLEIRNGATFNSARQDARPVLWIGRDVQRHSVAGDSAGNLDADRGDLGVAEPDSSVQIIALRADTVLGQQMNDSVLQRAQVSMGIAAALTEIDDRVRHDLAWPVVGHVAASIRFDDRDAKPREFGIVDQYMPARSGAADRVGRGMFREDDRVRPCVAPTFSDETTLKRDALDITNASNMNDLEVRRDHGTLARLFAS